MFQVVVSITAKGTEYVDRIKELLREASNIYVADPGTLQWYVSQSETNPLSFVIVELYDNKQAVAVHQANPMYKRFGATIKDWVTRVDVQTYLPIPGSKF
ncbi:hypothetical protein HDU91_006459 [Kappamyces sp. JEL0680]|nr:hypothetical protein HDU91_006459 [Kappamyces sp. JEL0680]